jgi:integrase
VRAKVVLSARVNDSEAGFPSVGVKIKRNAIVFPIERGRRMFGPDEIIGFYARYSGRIEPSDNPGRNTKPLGKDPITAYTRFQQIDQDFARIRSGLLPINVVKEPIPAENGNRDLRTCAAEFKANLVTLGKKKSTIRMYTLSVDSFVKQFPTKTIDAIDRKDMLAHLSWMRANLVKRAYGDQQHTFRNRLRDISVFFNTYGVKNPLPMRDVKKPMKKRPTKYSLEIINKMLKAATQEEKDLIQFFLNTGFRDEETAHAEWDWIDFKQGSINVHANDKYGWTPKDNESREQDIVLSDKFVKRMKARRERRSGSDLIFPSGADKPNMHLIDIVKKAAKRAGIIDKRITLHAFRRTFGTMVAKQYGIEQSRIWLGHSDIETTQRYIAADEMTTEQSRIMANEMFTGIGD